MCLETQTLALFMKDIHERLPELSERSPSQSNFIQQMKPKFKVPEDYTIAERANIVHII